MALIELHKVNKLYRTKTVETLALSDIDLHINHGDMLSITGKSGSGKSTLLNVLGMVEKPSSGSYQFDSHEVSLAGDSQLSRLRRHHFGFIFQSFNLIDQLNVEENVELPLKYIKMPKTERKSRIRDLLQQLEMDHRAQHFPHQLSGGQQQRVAIARAIATQPKVILADEPTGNLDSKNGDEVLRMLKELNQQLGSTIILITHDKQQAAAFPRQARLRDGHLEQLNV